MSMRSSKAMRNLEICSHNLLLGILHRPVTSDGIEKLMEAFPPSFTKKASSVTSMTSGGLMVAVAIRHHFSKACLQHSQTVFQPCMWFMEELSQFSVGTTAQRLTCSIMEKPQPGLDDCLRMLLPSCRKRMSGHNGVGKFILCIGTTTASLAMSPLKDHFWNRQKCQNLPLE